MKKWGQRGMAVTAAALTLLACGCVVLRLPAMDAGSAAVAAAGFILPGGAAEAAKAGFPPEEDAEGYVSLPNDPPISALESSSEPEGSSQAPSDPPSSQEEEPAEEGSTRYEEVVIQNTGTNYDNIWVLNRNNNHDIDIAAELEKQPAVTIKKDGTPQVLLYHTHTTEAYQGVTRSQDSEKNMVSVGNRIAEQLEAAGIGVVHDTTVHDYPSYNGSYSRSADTIQRNLEQYPSIQVILDIHRDALGTDDVRKKPTVTVDGKKAAQVMIISGCDDQGTLGYPDWEYNLRLGVRLQKSLSDLYPGLPRPLNFFECRYNQHLSKGALLVEVGTDGNTLEEAMYSGELVGKALAQVLNQLTQA